MVDIIWSAFTMDIIELGDTVVCDVCNEDYTDSDAVGGFVFGSYGYCPICAVDGMKSIIKYKEERMIKAVCPPTTSFGDFIRRYRNGNNKLIITTHEKDLYRDSA